MTFRTGISATSTVTPLPTAAPAWVRIGSLVLCLLGLAVSAYLTVEHYSHGATLACPESATINCVKVTTSRYATFLGMPVAVLGLAYYVVMTGLCTPPAWAARAQLLPRVRLVAAGAGVVAVVYLIWAELFRLDAICLWCTGVHVITIVLFAGITLAAAL